MTIITKDKTTENLLSDVTVSLFQNGLEIQRLHTNQNGKVSKEVPLGFIYFYASKKGYLPIEMGSYVNLKTNEITLSLSKDSTKQNIENKYIINESILVETNNLDKLKEIELPINKEEKFKDTITKSISLKPLDSLPENQFDMYHFKPLNVTFVIDISSSMKIGDRLELMKFALHQLSSILRKEDQLSIVSYATEAEVLLNTTSGDKKE